MYMDVVMPQMGESLAEGTVVRWLKKPGEEVKAEEPLLEITTDKVDTEVPAPTSGVLEEILIREGETVAVGTVLARIRSAEARAERVEKSSSDRGHFASDQEVIIFSRGRREAKPEKEKMAARGANFYSPAVLSLAREAGLPLEELSRIKGSGAGGRVTRKDLAAYLEAREKTAAAAPEAVGISAAYPAVEAGRPEEETIVPMTAMRKKIAEHMLLSQRVAAHVTGVTECDMTRIVDYREREKENFRRREGFELTYMPFVAVAAIKALRQFPIFNSSVVEDKIVLKRNINLGIAVALEDGLIVPVIKRAQEKSFVGLARAINELASKARNKELVPDDVQGGTFTITNPGMFGGLFGTPIINQPQVAILGLGAIVKRPVVIDDAIAIRSMMYLSLSFDHRVIDGAVGFQFLEKIRRYLENFDLPE